jgi:hypothetical protein
VIRLYHESHFTFRFNESRIIPCFHLEGIEAERKVSFDPDTDERLDLMAVAIVGEGGWVNLSEPIIVKPGDAFIVVPEAAQGTVTAAAYSNSG